MSLRYFLLPNPPADMSCPESELTPDEISAMVRELSARSAARTLAYASVDLACAVQGRASVDVNQSAPYVERLSRAILGIDEERPDDSREAEFALRTLVLRALESQSRVLGLDIPLDVLGTHADLAVREHGQQLLRQLTGADPVRSI